jgi:hypothetical protein
MKSLPVAALLLFCSVCATPSLLGAVTSSPLQTSFPSLPKPGTKVPIDANCHFTYGFVKEPKIGTAIMRVEVFTRDGKRDTSFLVKGDADMPSMRGAHSAGEKEFSLSGNGVYLLPVRLVMPGDWEIRFTFVKDGRVVFRGAYLFDL